MSVSRDLTEEGRPAVRPTAERLAKGGVVIPYPDRENPQARPARVENQTVLDRYKSRKTLDDEQLAAAYRWFGYAARSKRFPKCTMSWSGPVNNGFCDNTSDTIAAAGIQRDQGITFLLSQMRKGKPFGPTYVSVVEHVCVNDLHAQTWAIERGFHHMKGVKLLREALDRLCKYYGIKR